MKLERFHKMNMIQVDLLEPVTASLKHQGLVLRRLVPSRSSGVPQSQDLIRVAKGNASVDYLIKAKRGVTQATLGPLLAQLNDKAKESGFRGLLLTDYLPPPVAEKLRFSDWAHWPLAARSGDVEHRVEIRNRFWGPQLFAEQSARTVPPVLVYADLLATGDARCFEAAGLVYDRHLAELLPAA